MTALEQGLIAFAAAVYLTGGVVSVRLCEEDCIIETRRRPGLDALAILLLWFPALLIGWPVMAAIKLWRKG